MSIFWYEAAGGQVQIRIQGLDLESEIGNQMQSIIVRGLSAEGQPVCVVLSDAATANLVQQVLSLAGPQAIRARLEAQPCLWECPLAEWPNVAGSFRPNPCPPTCVLSLCEQIRAAVFEPGRGEPILVGFPPWQGEGLY
jgi:hypothetical protein